MNTKKTTNKKAAAQAETNAPIEATETIEPTVEATETIEAAPATTEAEIAPTEAPEAVGATEDAPTAEVASEDAPEAPAEAKATKAAKVEKVAKPTSKRYERACYHVSETQKAFLLALDEKCELLGTKRVNESVGVYNHPDAYKLNEAIKHCRMELEGLLQRKRELKVKADGLDKVNERISFLRRQRQKARQEKKAAMAELTGTAKTDATATEQEAETEAA